MTSIRLADKTDVNDIQRISSVLTLDVPGFKWDQRDYIEQEIAKGNYYVLELEGKVVAIISTGVESKTGLFGTSKTGFINALAVERTKQKSGLGKLLIEFAIRHARENGATSLVVESFEQYGLLDYYPKFGFKKVATREVNSFPYHVFKMLL
jgi:predicted N-acetyltransferase YhbS